jgi:hypothetical protein
MTAGKRLGLALWATGMLLGTGTWGQDSIWALQAVDATGEGTHPKVGAAPVPDATTSPNRVTIQGIALNRSDEYLDPNSMWQVYVQAEPPDRGGIAAWAGIFYNSDWPRYPTDIEPGDRVEINGFVADNRGKVNINERHSAAPGMQFVVTVLERGVGLPTPIEIPSIADCNYFDETRSGGGELYQAQWMQLRDVHIVSGTWGAGEELIISDVSGATTTLLLSSEGDFDSFPPPIETFSPVGTFDQEDIDLPYHDHYRLWVKNYGDLKVVTGLPDWSAYR